MKNINEEALHWVQALAFIVLWLLFSLVTGEHEISWKLLAELPHVVAVYAILAVVFVKWGWRLKFFHPWLVPFPNLQGTWEGEIKSTWVNPETGQSVPPIPSTLTIRQTFSSIACVLRTAESESESTAAQLSEAEGTGVVRLHYTYANRPQAGVRHRSEMHDGAAVLTLTVKQGEPQSLEGPYWTSRRTTGDMKFSRVP
jgi:predicted pore-forming effector associated with SMODS systems